jgi:hypothetical protein
VDVSIGFFVPEADGKGITTNKPDLLAGRHSLQTNGWHFCSGSLRGLRPA